MPRQTAKSKQNLQNLTVSLSRETIRKARILAARRETSVSRLVAAQIETLVGQDEAYQEAMRDALALLDKGFHMGGLLPFTREDLHDRKALR